MRDNLYAVKALSPTDAWAAGNYGKLFHTSDGGKTWSEAPTPTKSPLFGVDFGDASHGWAVGKAGLVLHTADGGTTWTAQKTPLPTDKHLFVVRALDAETAWIAGDWGALAVTEDGGATWQDRSLGGLVVKMAAVEGSRQQNTLSDDVVLYDISFPDAEHGYVVGEFGTVLATSDGGATWTKLELGVEKTLFSVSFSTPTFGFVVGIDGLVFRTKDGGQTWEKQRGSADEKSIEELGFMETLNNPGLYSVSAAGQYAVVAGDTGTVLTTADGGDTWAAQELPEKQRLTWLRGASLVPGTHGFVVGASGFSLALDHDKVVLP